MTEADLRRTIAAMPISLDPKFSVTTKQLYVPFLKHAGEGVTQEHDVAYGPHVRQRLDVFHVPGTAPKVAVIYVPGGGYTGGDKRSDDTIFANIGCYFARRGMLGITMNYRLAPEVQWPAGAQDVASAVAWVKANGKRYGMSTDRIVVFGHSAGASHCATYLFDPEIKGGEQIAGAVLVSGPAYRLDPSDLATRPNFKAYFGDDQTRFDRLSAANHVAGTKVPVMLAVAERDPADLVTPTLELAIALTRRDGVAPKVLQLPGHNHYSPPCSIGSFDDELGGAITRFVLALQ